MAKAKHFKFPVIKERDIICHNFYRAPGPVKVRHTAAVKKMLRAFRTMK